MDEIINYMSFNSVPSKYGARIVCCANTCSYHHISVRNSDITMPQGKIKVKSQLPTNVKGKKIKKLDKAKPKKVVQRNLHQH